jgi:hypothetical protein
VGGVTRRLGEQRSLVLKKSNTNTRSLLGSKMGQILANFYIRDQFWAPSARVEAFHRLRGSLPKMVIRVSKGESQPERILSSD